MVISTAKSKSGTLVDMGGKLAGYCDRIVERSRQRGVFACSGSAKFRSVTRYTFAWATQRRTLFLNETDYRSEPSPCENGGRRVDSIAAQFFPWVSFCWWSGGQQILRRRREKD